MSVNKKSMARVWVDPDEIPDMSTPYWQKKFNEAPVARGRPVLPVTKISTTIRLDKDVLDSFRKDGPGWQTRINDALRQFIKP